MSAPKDPIAAAMQRRGILPPDPPTWRERVMAWVAAENDAAQRPAVSADTTTADAAALLGPQEEPTVPALNSEQLLLAAAGPEGSRNPSVADALRRALEGLSAP